MKPEVPLILYSSSRPGYELGRNPVPPQVVDEWIEDVKSQGVVSILCLLADDQLRLYAGLPTGLLAYYRAKGLTVGHVPAMDHASPPLSAAQLAEVEQAFSALPKPVLVHCSAGIDRTGLAVQHLKLVLQEGPPTQSAKDREPAKQRTERQNSMKFDKIVLAIPHSVRKTDFSNWDRPEVAKADSDRWTDWFTDKLFTPPQRERIVAVVGSVPRFDCDLERITKDPLESVGRGILYHTSHSGARRLDSGEDSLHHWHDYRKAIAAELTPNSLLVDCHSFPSDISNVDICIGINDDWSSPDRETLDIVLQHFCDYKVAINDPFSGSLTPEAGFPYTSLMIEVNKRLYLNEDTLTESAFAYKLHNTICSLFAKLFAL